MPELYKCYNPEYDNDLNSDLFEHYENSEENENSEIDSILNEFDY